MSDLLLISRAADFAARRHVGDRRKGAAAEPYVNHLAEVALLLAEATDGREPALVAAGWLHDTVEDTGTALSEIEALFGPDVAGIVAEVTDDKTLPKPERKRRQEDTVHAKSREARLLKIADKTSNLRSLIASPPAHWEAQRIADYAEWAARVVEGCRGLNPRLDEVFDAALAEARALAGRSAA